MVSMRIFGISAILISSVAGGQKFSLGTPSALLGDILSRDLKVSSTFEMSSVFGEKIPLGIENYHYGQEDGYLSMVGRALERPNSEFMLKGTKGDMYGWVVLRDKNVAYEYTTSASGELIAEEVPVTKIYPICNIHEESAPYALESPMQAPAGPEPHIGPYPGTVVNKLQSRPGAKKVLWIDATSVMTGEEPTTITKEGMWQSWQSLASGFSNFDVNVTTDPDVYKAAGVANSGIAKLLNQTGRSNCGLNAFGSARYCNLFKSSSGYGQGRTILHEVGHLMGLSHDGGQPGGEYYTGNPTFKWVPIMGNFWSGNSWGTEALYQWSKGEYSGASMNQDDLKIINAKFEYRADDIPTSVPLVIDATGKVSPEANRGAIEKNTDTDAFTFRIVGGAGRAKFRVNRTEYLGGSMLDIHASIQSAEGGLVAQNNANAIRFANFDVNLPAGDYTLTIKGGAEGTPQNGFSNFSSLGFYAVDGSITGGVTGVEAKKASPVKVTPVADGKRVSIRYPAQFKSVAIALVSAKGETVYRSLQAVESIDMHAYPSGVYAAHFILDGKKSTSAIFVP